MGPTSRSQPSGKRARKPSSKLAEGSLTVTNSEDEEVQEDTKQRTKVRRTSWTTNRTERLLDWLEENPADRQKLFSDSTKDAKDEGRRKRVAKGTKSEFHKMIATYVFSVDENEAVRADFAVNTINYTKSVDNYLGRLRKEYRQFNEALGRTGAGLRYEDVEEGSSLWNLIEQLEQDFPYWKRLHGFWRTLPNFNPYTASSEPGQDLASEALALVQGRGQNRDNYEDDFEYVSDGADDDAGGTQKVKQDDKDSLADEIRDDDVDLFAAGASASVSPIDSPTPAGRLPQPTVFHETKNFTSAPSSNSTPRSKATPSTAHTSASQKKRVKRSHQDAFADENKAEAEILATLAAEKHARKMAEHAQRMVELEIKKQRMDLDANEKRLQAEDRRLAAQHQREREKEAHDLQMFRLRLQYQGANAGGLEQFGAQQFGNFGDPAQAAFGGDLHLPPFNN
jgi:hypothetical protein